MKTNIGIRARRWMAVAASAFLGLTLLAPAPGQDPAPKVPVPSGVVVPFEMLPSNHMVVNARFNGKDKLYRLIFDLGSPVTLLSGRAAEDAGALPKNAPRSFIFGTRGEGKLDMIELGDLKSEKLPVMVMDHPALKALGGLLGKPLDGILGYTFFAHYKTTIDYQARKMTFTPVTFEVKDLMKDMPNRIMGPKVAKTIYLSPSSLWGFTTGSPEGGVSSRGLPVLAVVEGSPASVGGLKVGDLVTSFDGRWTTTVADLFAAAADAPPGQAVALIVLRDDKEVTLTITPKDGL